MPAGGESSNEAEQGFCGVMRNNHSVSMRQVTRWLLWLLVFSVPWGLVPVPVIGTISRSLGLATIAAGALTTLVEGRMRKPGVIFWLAVVFAIASVLSLFWTVSYTDTAERVGTYLQLVGLIWVVREFARTREEQSSLLLAFCLGAFVLAFDLLQNFGAGAGYRGSNRYSASGINPNYLGFTLVVGFPMAWHLLLRHRGAVRIFACLFCLAAPLAIVLTGGRGAFLAGLVALSVIPLTVGLESSRGFLLVMLVVLAAAVTIVMVVPESSWNRMMTIVPELEGGTMSGRIRIWDAGWSRFQERPILGAGAGAFPAVVEPILNRARAAHNTTLALLVEQGIVGFGIFASLLGACAWVIFGLPPPDRKMWAVLMVAWAILSMSGDAHFDKVTWVLFGLLAAQERMKTTVGTVASPQWDDHGAAGQALPRRLPARRIRSIAASR